MMSITYKEICQFFENKNEIHKIQELAKKFPAFGIFQYLLDHKKAFSHKDDIQLTFVQAKDFLEKFLAGNLAQKDVNYLFNAILQSEKNFRIIYSLLEQNRATLSQLEEIKEYKNGLPVHEVLEQINQLKNNAKHQPKYDLSSKKIVTGILSVAAIFLILFLLPLELHKDLNDYYSFDESVPLEFNESGLRGNEESTVITDPDYKQFKFRFNQGMADYLAQEYSNALNEWTGLESKLNIIKTKPGFDRKDEYNFILYNALCRIALYLSNNENIDKEFKQKHLKEAINLFKKLPLNNDMEKYYYSLALGLTNDKVKALKILSSINKNSDYYSKRIILEEQLRE